MVRRIFFGRGRRSLLTNNISEFSRITSNNRIALASNDRIVASGISSVRSSNRLQCGDQYRSITTNNEGEMYDVLLIGGGVMSCTLGTMLQKLEPKWKIKLVEVLDKAGEESSNGWNNAGTGHSALCELNYTPQDEDGTIDISKAIKICEQFLNHDNIGPI